MMLKMKRISRLTVQKWTSVVLHSLEIVSIPVDQLGQLVGSLSDDSQLIVAALDELLSRAWK